EKSESDLEDSGWTCLVLCLTTSFAIYYRFFRLNRRYETTFQHFVSRVLLLNNVRHIWKFRLVYECHDRSAPIPTWLGVAISHNIRELELDFCFSVRGKIVDLPISFYTSSVLSVLKLSRMPLNVPSIVSFPSLKILELRRIMYFDDKCFETLLSGCPILEELVVEETARVKPKVVLISSHTLRSFSFSYRFVIDMILDIPYKFIINLPHLEFFHVKGSISDVFEIRSLAGLDTAYMDLRHTDLTAQSYNIYHQRIFDLFRGIANANSVTLSSEIVQLLCEDLDRSLPKFSNLKQLAFGIGFDFCWKRILVDFIKCSSYLEVFTINNKRHGFSSDIEEVRRIPLQTLPDDMIPYLKRILIDELYANFMPEYIEHLMHHVNVLKRLEINCRCPTLLRSQIGLTS
ncbi:hypothetical protein KSS87_002963, partial [Heliosperma pusillum]